jgi:hypothetical protein
VGSGGQRRRHLRALGGQLDPRRPRTRIGGAALDDAKVESIDGRSPDGRVDEVRDRLVGRGRDADPLSGADQLDDHPRSGEGLAGPRRPLDRKDRAVERQGHAACHRDDVVAVASERGIFRDAHDSRRSAE